MSLITTFRKKASNKLNRMCSSRLYRRMHAMRHDRPIVTFTFDDFPKSALDIAGKILAKYGARGTYFTAFGLMGTDSPTGRIFDLEDIDHILKNDHDLGCHTYHHYHAFNVSTQAFEASVHENRGALAKHFPQATFKSLSYPISFPRPTTKSACSKYFVGCRAGGQTINRQYVDLNKINSFFIEQHLHAPQDMLDLIDFNDANNGWLIFSTHDVCDKPTRFGCNPEIFESLVHKASQSNAEILTMAEALKAIGAPKA